MMLGLWRNGGGYGQLADEATHTVRQQTQTFVGFHVVCDKHDALLTLRVAQW